MAAAHLLTPGGSYNCLKIDVGRVLLHTVRSYYRRIGAGDLLHVRRNQKLRYDDKSAGH